ncbi:MAG: 50S ribosomal protein L9 [Tissierellia bacterium]|nr:50S ribosomal protein L9 [Tissierellia bacterium]
MKVILLQDVENLGKAGDLADVKSGYARNFLFPRKYAIEGTEANMASWKEQKAKEEAEEAARVEEAQALKAKLEAFTAKVEAKSGETGRLFGAITSQDIADAIQEGLGLKISRKKIEMEDNLKALGEYTLPVRLYTGVVAELKVEVVEK